MNQYELFSEANKQAENLSTQVDTIYNKWGAWTAEAANFNLIIASIEKVSPAALAFTHMHESTFKLFPEANTNNHPTDFKKHDVGPYQLNVGWLEKDLEVKFFSSKGLDVPKVTGTLSPLMFNGSPFQNGRMAARKLKRLGVTDEERVIKYTGPAARPNRIYSWQKFGRLFELFFETYKLNPELNVEKYFKETV